MYSVSNLEYYIPDFETIKNNCAPLLQRSFKNYYKMYDHCNPNLQRCFNHFHYSHWQKYCQLLLSSHFELQRRLS